MSKLLLIDGHAILHRAYHALPPNFTAPDGTQTNAVYGFTSMLLRVLSDLKPDYLAVAFDLPQPTFRQQLYTAYQGKRPEMEGNLSGQIPLVHEMLEALNVAHFEVGGFEADDVIGTLAKQSDIDTIIVTGDRDMLQLVNDHVKVMVPVKGLGETKTYDTAKIKEEFGVTPSQWVDVKALKGDPSDNYLGVPGIGPKTAQDLIAKFGTLEEVYKNLGKLKPNVAKKLAEGAESAGLGKKLAAIVTDVPVYLDLAKADVTKINWKAGIEYMRSRLGFKSIPEKIEKEYLNNNKISDPVTQLHNKHDKKSDGQIELL